MFCIMCISFIFYQLILMYITNILLLNFFMLKTMFFLSHSVNVTVHRFEMT